MHPAKRNPRMRRAAVLVPALLAASACANDRGPYPNLPPLGLQAEFTSKNLCGLGVSPEVRLGGVPAGTATYRWRITNVSVLFAQPWQIDLPANGPTIPEGAVAEFPTPCLGELELPRSTTYRFEIMALAADRRPLAYGWNFISARSLPYQLDIERMREARRIEAPDRTAPVSASRPSFFIQ